jgi:DNA-binding NarL/FixJ family response regulator
MVDRVSPGTGAAHGREERIDKAINRGTLIAGLAYSGRLAGARAQGEALLSRFAAAATIPGGLGAIAAAHHGLSMTYALQGEPVLARQSYAASIAAYQASDNQVFAHAKLREELIVAVLPYQADDLAERERVATAAERMAVWVVERGGHRDPHLPQYARVPLLVLEGQWREARAILEYPATPDLANTPRVLAFYRGTLARAQGEVETAWRCVYEPWRLGPETEPGERMGGAMPLWFQLLAVGLALDAGDLDTARRWLDAHRRWLDFMDAVLGRADEAVLEAQWHRDAGDAERAREHAMQALVHATTPRQPLALLAAHRMLGILDTDAGAHVAAAAHFARTLALTDACHAPYERALTLIDQAEALVMMNANRHARGMLDEAKALCLPMGAVPSLTRIERLAARFDDATEGLPAGLSAREVEVLRLVATGLSNVRIAERLFLSPNTVRVHLANIFAKIGVHNRAAATTFARQHGLA